MPSPRSRSPVMPTEPPMPGPSSASAPPRSPEMPRPTSPSVDTEAETEVQEADFAGMEVESDLPAGSEPPMPSTRPTGRSSTPPMPPDPKKSRKVIIPPLHVIRNRNCKLIPLFILYRIPMTKEEAVGSQPRWTSTPGPLHKGGPEKKPVTRTIEEIAAVIGRKEVKILGVLITPFRDEAESRIQVFVTSQWRKHTVFIYTLGRRRNPKRNPRVRSEFQKRHFGKNERFSRFL